MQPSKWSQKRYDVVVCGAGSAGCAAAFAAALAGARTLLVERLGFCGGTPVAAGIHTLDAVHSCQNPAERVVGRLRPRSLLSGQSLWVAQPQKIILRKHSLSARSI